MIVSLLSVVTLNFFFTMLLSFAFRMILATLGLEILIAFLRSSKVILRLPYIFLLFSKSCNTSASII